MKNNELKDLATLHTSRITGDKIFKVIQSRKDDVIVERSKKEFNFLQIKSIILILKTKNKKLQCKKTQTVNKSVETKTYELLKDEKWLLVNCYI